MTNIDTRETILSAARLMVQARGYNALSFRELGKAVGIKSASIHYHFPTKGDLGVALAQRYADDAATYFDALLASGEDLQACMVHYTAVFRAALEKNNRMCLCGIMAAEYDDLPAEVRVEVDRFTDINVRWLAVLLGRAHPAAEPGFLQARALAIFAAVEGAQLVARGRGDIGGFDQVIAAYVASGLFD